MSSNLQFGSMSVTTDSNLLVNGTLQLSVLRRPTLIFGCFSLLPPLCSPALLSHCHFIFNKSGQAILVFKMRTFPLMQQELTLTYDNVQE